MAVTKGSQLGWRLMMMMTTMTMMVVRDVRPQVLQATSSSESNNTQCNEGLPAPDQPFRVVWNHPDTCERHGFPLHLDQYGIIFNRRRQFLGEEVQTLYRTGLWPTYNHETGQPNHGGLPQLFNDTAFTKTWQDLRRNRVINFTGLAIMDFEAWRAIYYTNYGSMRIYQTQSVNLVRRRNPSYRGSMLKRTAQREWEQAARRIMSSKLAIGQSLMPGGHWGYYNYPRPWDGNSSPGQNNRIAWLWRQATGLYPSIYLRNPNQTTSAKVYFVDKAVREAVRIQNTFSPPNTVIYPYSNLQQGDDIFFNEDHLKVTLRLPADMGASGIVLWGSSSYYRNPGRQCKRLQEHLRTVLGPFVLNLTQVMADCSDTLCGGHGRCVHNSKDYLLPKTEALKLSSLCAPRDSRYRDYHCRCYSSWKGACCHTPKPSACQQQLVSGSESSTHGQIRNSTKTSTTRDPKSITDVLGRANETSLIG